MRFVHSGYSPFPWDNLEKKERKENKTHGESVRDDACGYKEGSSTEKTCSSKVGKGH